MNDIRDITSPMKDISKSNASIAKQIDAVSKSLGEVSKAIRRTNALENASLLTSDELAVLRDLASAGNDTNEHCQQKIRENPSLRGTYLALADAGFLSAVEECGDDVFVFDITNRGRWAIEHRAALDSEQKAKERRETIRFAFGVLVELAAVVLAWWLGINGPALVTATP